MWPPPIARALQNHRRNHSHKAVLHRLINVAGIPPRARTITDSSIMTTVSGKIRYVCMEVAMEMGGEPGDDVGRQDV